MPHLPLTARPRRPLDRRGFIRNLATATAAVALLPRPAEAKLPEAKITRVRIFNPPNVNPLFNQSNLVCTVETDSGLVGIGEGGSKDTLTQCAQRLIGRNPFDTELNWQDMYRAFFYPPGREKIHALGALDLALWDMKGKALDVPVYDLLGGMARKYCELYTSTGGNTGQLKEAARRAMENGYRAFRMDAASLLGGADTFDTHERARQVVKDCEALREGVGPNGDWLVDLHQRFDFADSLRICKQIENLEPYLVEDPTRTEGFLEDIPKLRKLTTVPLAAGEEWGQRWDFNKLVENHDVDYVRATLPNVGGITEMQKIAALCETHFVGIVPHFTGPISTAALVHVLGPFSGPTMFEIGGNNRPFSYLPECLELREGKLWPNKRPGLGVTLDMAQLTPIGEVTDTGPRRTVYFRKDGSITNW